MMTAIEQASQQFMAAAERLPTLWSLTQEFEQLIWLLEQPEADPAEVDAEMQRVVGDIRQKAHGVATVIDSLEGLAAFQKAGADKLAAKAKANQAHADRLRGYALACMKTIGQDRLETGHYTLSVRLNPPSVNVTDASAIPGEYQRTKVEVSVDKRAILEAFKATGEIPPGAEIERRESLRIS